MLDVLKKNFGHSQLRPGQSEIINSILAGNNTLAILPTGGGKSLCYQLPALLTPGLTIVISPLIALMRDQVESLSQRGIPAMRWDSEAGEFEQLVNHIQSGELKILYLSPERIQSRPLLALLRQVNISLIAIDEAHCVSEWGQSFRSAYLKLGKTVRSLKPAAVLALTATATPDVARSIRKEFKILKRHHIQTSFHRENLHYQVISVSNEEKNNALLETLTNPDHHPAVVYATRRENTEHLSAFLSKNSIPARAFHAGIPPKVRGEIQDSFLRGEFPVICATIAFGMGVDMPNIRTVVHYHPPKSPEGWMQECGRAGRDGQISHCVMLINDNDQKLLESIVQAHRPSLHAVEMLLSKLFSQGKRAVISRYNLSTLNDINTALVDILLARLESDGFISSDEGSWLWCHAVPLVPMESILHGFRPKEQTILRKFLEPRQRVSLLEVGDGTVPSQLKLMKLLSELRETGDARTKFSHSLSHFKIRKAPQDIKQLAQEMHQVCSDHVEANLTRITDVFAMSTSRRCLARSLLSHFGEKLPTPCGNCSQCRGQTPSRKLPYSPAEEITEHELEAARSVADSRHPALSSPERLARFLGGIYSPAMMRYRLYQRDQWALLARLPYDDILATTRTIVT